MELDFLAGAGMVTEAWARGAFLSSVVSMDSTAASSGPASGFVVVVVGDSRWELGALREGLLSRSAASAWLLLLGSSVSMYSSESSPSPQRDALVAQLIALADVEGANLVCSSQGRIAGAAWWVAQKARRV